MMPLYSKLLSVGTAALFLLVPEAAPNAHAAQEIVLTTDQTQIVKLPEAPTKIILGNPSVADVTTDGNTLLLNPRGYGLTNLIVLDDSGNKLGDYLIRVIFEDSYSLSMYSPGALRTYSCRKNCQMTLHIGDEAAYFDKYTTQLNSKNSLALGQPAGGSLSPSVPAGLPEQAGVVVTPPPSP